MYKALVKYESAPKQWGVQMYHVGEHASLELSVFVLKN